MPKMRDAMSAEIPPASAQPQCCRTDDGKEVLRTRDPKMSPKTSKKMVPTNPSEPATILRTPPAVGNQLG